MSKKENRFRTKRNTESRNSADSMEVIIRRFAKRMADRRLFPPASVSSDVWASVGGQEPKPAA